MIAFSPVKVCGVRKPGTKSGSASSAKKASGSTATVANSSDFDITGKVTDAKGDSKLLDDLKEWRSEAEKNILSGQSNKQAEDNYRIAIGIGTDVGEGAKVIPVRSGGKLQAAATVMNRGDHTYVELLATNPRNIALKDRPAETKGAGKAAIAAVVQASIAAGHGGKVKLGALPGAVSFYEKIGFTKDKGRGSSFNVPDMTLSASAAQSFLASYKSSRGS